MKFRFSCPHTSVGFFAYINLKNPLTRSHLRSSNCTKIDFGWGSAPDPAGEAYSAPPNPLPALGGPISKERKGKGGKRREAEGREDKEEEGGERDERSGYAFEIYGHVYLICFSFHVYVKYSFEFRNPF